MNGIILRLSNPPGFLLRGALALFTMATVSGVMPVRALDLRRSSDYSSSAEVLSSGGSVATSANYSSENSLGEIIGFATAPNAVMAKSGFVSETSHADSLSITASPTNVQQGGSTRLNGWVTLDDGTRTNLTPEDIQWSIQNGAILSISNEGIATAGSVFTNSPASVRGFWGSVYADLSLTVLVDHIANPANESPVPTFLPENFSAARVGIYHGILRNSSGAVVGALANISLLGTRAFSGKVIFNGVTYSLTGSFLPDGSFSGSVLRTGRTPLTVALQMVTSALGGLALQGSVSGDGVTGEGVIPQAPFSASRSAPVELVRSYTFLIPRNISSPSGLPMGDGFGSLTVSRTGIIALVGRTGDGMAFSHSGRLTADRQWHLFQPLYGGKGQLAGVITFRDVPAVSDLDGGLHWVKNPNLKDKSYPAGFDLSPTLIGSIYARPAANQRALPQLASQNYNARLSLEGSTLTYGGVSKVVSWLGTNVVTCYGPETLSAATVATTGIISGSYLDPGTRRSVGFSGAVLQKQGVASGNFLFNNLSGRLLVECGTSFPYPGSEGAGSFTYAASPGSVVLPPNLATASFSSLVAGTYGGVLTRSSEISGGLESMVVTATGAFSGTVIFEGIRYAFKGVFSSSGTAVVTITRKGLSNITGNLQLALASGTMDGFQVTGSFTVDNVTYDVDAQRYPVFTIAQPAPQTGRYTLAMLAPSTTDVTREPGGDGYASVTVAYTGAVAGTLVLPDGTTAMFGGRVSRGGEWSFHRSTYSGGYVAGKLAFRDVAGISDADGQWRWVKPNAVPGTKTYPAGFRVTRSVVACRYIPPAATVRALSSLATGNYNAWLRLHGSDLSSLPALTLDHVDHAITWTSANQLLYYGPEKVRLVFAPTTGLLSGTLSDPTRGVNVSLGGVLLQKQGLVVGRYGVATQSGWLHILPR